MVRGGRRGRPKQLSGLVSPSNSVAAQNVEAKTEVSIPQELIDGTVQDVIEQVRISAMAPDETISPTRSTIRSYVAMTDPDEGTTLTFFKHRWLMG